MYQEIPLDVTIILVAGTAAFVFLISFLVGFLFLYQKKQIQNIQEKASLKAQFEQEILSSQNEIKEETMKYISRELHDNVAQMLALVKIQLNNAAAELPANAQIGQSKEHLNTAIMDLRALSKTLNTDNILHEGLSNTIKFELQRIEKASGISIEFVEKTTQPSLNVKQEIIVFRIFQELMQNILKHAQAKNIRVCLEEHEKCFKIEVEDNGIGFDFDEKLKKKGFESGTGLANMVYRANLLGGSFQVLNVKSGGSIAVLLIPHTT